MVSVTGINHSTSATEVLSSAFESFVSGSTEHRRCGGGPSEITDHCVAFSCVCL